MAYEFYSYPEDFLEKYRTGIEKVTQQDVDRVAQKYVHKDKLAVLVVGKAASGHELGKKRWQEFPVPAEKVNQQGCDAEIQQVIGGR